MTSFFLNIQTLFGLQSLRKTAAHPQEFLPAPPRRQTADKAYLPAKHLRTSVPLPGLYILAVIF